MHKLHLVIMHKNPTVYISRRIIEGLAVGVLPIISASWKAENRGIEV
jgi:hypothetical protein